MNKAEDKLVKVGESSACNDGANPEPSSSEEQACVETRRRVCINCEEEIPSIKYKSAKYCSKRCSSAYLIRKFRERHGLIEKPGVGSGGNQLEEKNPNWKNSGTCYRAKALRSLENICSECGNKEKLEVHHKDKNRKNHSLDNLQILCKKCHKKIHVKRNSDTGQYIKG